MASVQTYLSLISQYESNNQNVPNYRFGPGYTAQGYYQITNTNWSQIAPLVGIDTSLYPNAMSAPQDLQAKVAAYLLTQTPAGISNWAAYNPQLATALNQSGLQTSGQVVDFATGNNGSLVDLTGTAATASTTDILDQLDSSASDLLSQAGLDPTYAGLAIAVGIGVLAFVALN